MTIERAGSIAMAEDIPQRRKASCDVSVHLGLLLIGWATLTLFQEMGTREKSLGLYAYNHFHISAPHFLAVHLFALGMLLFLAAWIECGWIIPMGSWGMILGAIWLQSLVGDPSPGVILGGLFGFVIGLLSEAIEDVRQTAAGPKRNSHHPKSGGRHEVAR